jgi:phosphoribosylglycinamide formyltransferase 1
MTTSRSWRSAQRLFGRFTTSVSAIRNLVVELDRDFATQPVHGIDLAPTGRADERTLAWIDEAFGGTWSSEADVGSTIVASRDGAPAGFAALDPQGLKFAWLSGLGRERGTGIFGPLGVTPDERRHGLGRLLLRRSLNGLRERGYARALIPAVGDEELMRFYAESAGARVVERFERPALYRPRRRALVLASGNGSNFQAVLDASRNGSLPIEVVGLLSNDPRAFVLERARAAGVGAISVLAWDRAAQTRAAYDEALLDAAKSHRADLVLLLGWMHLLADRFVDEFPQLLNLHPAFLPLDPARDEVGMPDGAWIPAFRGPRAVRDALAAGSPWVGATFHRVTRATDRGPVMARKPLRVEAEEDEAHLMARVHGVEREVVRAGLLRWLFERDDL